MNTVESIRMALQSVWANKLRAFLTLVSVAIGVFAIVGAGSLVDAIEGTIHGEVEALGTTTFSITRRPAVEFNRDWRKYRKRKHITYSQYKKFKKKLTSTEMVSCHAFRQGQMVKYEGNETDPDVMLMGVDFNHFDINDLDIVNGRALLESDIRSIRNVIIIGNDIVQKCFKREDPIGKEVEVGKKKFIVVGVQEEKGAILGQSMDNRVYIPITQYVKHFLPRYNKSVDIFVKAKSDDALQSTMDESIGIMRELRKVEPWEDNSFEIATNEALKDQFSGLVGFLSYFGIITGAFSLIAAGVGIMNIMLVSVKERTREIGIRKAVGAKKSWIVIQFLVEAITLSNLGSIGGIVFGAAVAALVGTSLGLDLIIGINWIIISIVVCTLIGVIFGAYPAYRAAQLDPIDALRYE
jgi:putative ABC transport system permease protein